ncbi:MAG: hypothetical protein WDN26_19610 [Chitinophagaceae bacterium]
MPVSFTGKTSTILQPAAPVRPRTKRSGASIAYRREFESLSSFFKSKKKKKQPAPPPPPAPSEQTTTGKEKDPNGSN